MKPEDLNPSQVLSLFALGMIMFGLIIGSLVCWSFAVAFFRARKKFSIARGPLAMFGLIDIAIGIIFIFSMLIFVQFAASFTSPRAANEVATSQTDDSPETESTEVASPTEGKPAEKLTSRQVVLSGVFALGELITVFVVALFMKARTESGFAAMGWHPRSAGRDIGIGIVILLMTLPLLLILSATVNALTGVSYNHPVIEMMKQFPWLFGVVAWQAVIVAPIAEEFFFRSVLIGWFESIHFGRTKNAAIFGWNPIRRHDNSIAMSQESNAIPTGKVTVQSPLPESKGNDSLQRPSIPKSDALFQNPYFASPRIDTELKPTPENPRETVADNDGTISEFRPPWWPAIVSGILFGIAHISYGLSWIPLAVFGIVLGRVYQYRQSLIMCITIHMVFNAINLLNLWLSLGLPQPK
jgi:membrane protease YdiL (CAAX protease family)